MIKVLNVVGTITKGGTEKVIENIYGNIDSTKITAYIAYHEYGNGYKGDECLIGFEKYKVPPYYMLNAISYRNWWKDFLKKHHFDIIHVHYLDSAFLYLDLFQKDGAKTILHSHNTRRNPPTIGFYISIFNSFWARSKTDYAFACSKQAAVDFLGKKLANSSKTYIIKNGCNLSRFNYTPATREHKRKELNIANKLVLGNIGRFSYQKNHDFLIKVFYELHKKVPASTLLLIGDGEGQQDIKKLVCQLNLNSSVLFLGIRDDIPDLLNAMDIFVFPSHYEGLGIVLIEAQATGLKIFASDTIQSEADMGMGLLQKLSLQKKPRQWADKIIEGKEYIREDGSATVKENGYDIKDVSKWIENFLFDILKTN